MPYIEQEKREEVIRNGPCTPGELNYCLTEVLLHYESMHGAKYTTYNDIIGALEACKLEFYRRLVVPYEDDKRKTNGDVY